MSAYAIIPARGGSKGVPRKNISLLGGYPLVACATDAEKLTPSIERIIVSTDDDEVDAIARKFGAEVPFLRPAELAQDGSRDIGFMLHAIQWLREHEGSVPDYFVELRPTTPLRHPEDIEKAIGLIQKHPEATSLISSHEIRESPHKLFRRNGDYFEGLFPHDPRPEYWNLPRQEFPLIHQPDGYVDILKTAYMEERKRLQGDKMLAFVSPDTGEVDKEEDIKFIQFKLETEQWEVYEWLTKNFS